MVVVFPRNWEVVRHPIWNLCIWPKSAVTQNRCIRRCGKVSQDDFNIFRLVGDRVNMRKLANCYVQKQQGFLFSVERMCLGLASDNWTPTLAWFFSGRSRSQISLTRMIRVFFSQCQFWSQDPYQLYALRLTDPDWRTWTTVLLTHRAPFGDPKKVRWFSQWMWNFSFHKMTNMIRLMKHCEFSVPKGL